MIDWKEIDTNEQIGEKEKTNEISRVTSGVITIITAILLAYIVIIAIITAVVLLNDYA